ncbi:invasin domain 3-containing protein [Nocardioides sp. W7]|uniref:invasin domain 3-containing protein n=1 Tax=Nocardioides sp. W7 TaxID=2931390 RepID=UPI001FD47DD0|nr:invasin domain 3-containing protein [Nocardioides sp. W7]
MSRLRPTCVAFVLAVLAPAVTLGLASAAPAAAQPVPAEPVPADGPHLYASTYRFTGTQQTFTVPEGVSQVQVEAVGAAGGDGIDSVVSHGGRGAVVTGSLAVTEGQTLYLWVGGEGGSSAAGGARGWNGGGQGSQSNTRGGGGGGASDVRTCPAAVAGCDSIGSRVLIAAGGGGAGVADACATAPSCSGYPRGYVPGGDAGQSGASLTFGSRGTATGGAPGTATAGGAGGPGTSDTSEYAGYGATGTFTTGGDSIRAGGRTSLRGGGGGGGGLYGGGAGSLVQFYGAGGGGGSSLVPAGGTSTVAERGTTASLTISYDLGPVTEVLVRAEAGAGALVATGTDTRTIIATARTAGGARFPGLGVTFSSTDPDQSFGPVTDYGDGTYSATLTGSTTVGTATVTATAAGSTPAHDVLGTLDVETEGYSVAVAPVAETLVATGADSTTVTATAVTTSGKRLDGLTVSFTSTDPAQTLGTVAAQGNGTYSTTLQGSTNPGSATVTPAVTGGGTPTLTSTTVTTEGYTVTVTPVVKTLVATGLDPTPVTATAATTSGRRLDGLTVSFTSTDPAQALGSVTAGGNGVYSTTLRSSTTVGTATVTPTVAGAGTPTLTPATVTTEGYAVTVAPVSKTLVATGHETTPVTATAATTSGRRLGGLAVSFTSTDPAQTFGAVTEGANGTYSAALRGSVTRGAATVTATVTGAGEPTLDPATVTTEGYTLTVLPISERLLATGSATRTVTARARSESGRNLSDLEVSFTSTDPGQGFGVVGDRGDGTYTVRLTGSTTPGTAVVTAAVTGAGTPEVVPATLVTDPYLKPVVTASVTSTAAPRNGWYRSPVTVWFTCAGSLPLTAACPAPVVLGQGRDQSVTRSVTDSLGSSTSVTSLAVSIDQAAPRVRVTGARKGASYPRARKLSCRATDALSGVATCRVTTKTSRSAKGRVVRWTAIAVDRAGNRATSAGRYTIRKAVRR